MSKKDFDMSQLVSGLTGEQEEKNENRPQTVKRKRPMEHVCTLVSVEQMAKGLAAFHGAKRRFQTKGREKGIWVLDDYAHHPTEIHTTLEAAKQTNPKRLICVFQPHRYSRTKLLHKEFGQAFRPADLLVLTDIYPAGEAPIEGIHGETILEEVVEQTGQKVTYIKERENVAEYLRSIVEEGDMVMTMGAGDIYKTGEELVELLKEDSVS